MWVYGLDLAGTGYGQLADTCENANETSSSINELKTSQLLQKDPAPCSKYVNCRTWWKYLFFNKNIWL